MKYLHHKEESDPLYIILPYFNYCNFQRRKQLFLEFVERIRRIHNIRIVVIEAAHARDQFQLPKNIPGTFLHFGFVTKDKIWLKENLINLAVSRLPSSWKYMAWVDADITFLNPKWVSDTLQKLKTDSDVVQMFHTCVNMGPNQEALKIDRSFVYMVQAGKYVATDKYGFAHPGYAWAMTRKAYEQMGKLLDFGILGSGDRHMALALIGDVATSCPGNITKDYKRRLEEFQRRVEGLRIGYVNGTILHHWHGRLEDRKYRERWSILTKNEYIPTLDIEYNSHGLIQLTERGAKHLSDEIATYFMQRNEDNMEIA